MMGSRIQCPQCLKYVRLEEKCRLCGYSFKREAQRKKEIHDNAMHLYYQALFKDDINAAFESLGVLRLLKEKDVPILHTNLLLEQECYQEVIDILKNAKFLNQSTQEIAFSQLLTAYAETGDYVEFIYTVQHSPHHITYWESAYYMILLRKKNTQEQLEEKVRTLNEKYHITDPDYQVYYEEPNDALVYKRKVLQELSKTLSEGIDLKRRYLFSKEINGDTAIPASVEEQSKRYDWILQEYINMKYSAEEQEQFVCMLRLLIALNKDDSWSISYITEAEHIITQWLTIDIINCEEIDNVLVYANCLLKLGHYIKLDDYFKEKAGMILKKYDDYSLKTKQKIATLVQKVFAYEYVTEGVDKTVQNLLQKCEVKPSELKDEMENMMLYAVLTPTGQSALKVADFFFEKSKTDEFCFIDAGPISLNYFRIIELELNNLMVQPLTDMLTIDELTKSFDSDIEALNNEKARESYKNKWSRFQQELKKIKENKQHGITLGSLAVYLRHLAHNRGKGSIFVNYIWLMLEQIMTEEGCIAVQTGEIATMINQDVLEKYRNPPAHTRYLPYQTACECKKYVTDCIIKMQAWFKENNVSE